MKARIGIVGVSGYGGGEVLRICASHPDFEIVYLAGESSAGSKLIDRYPGVPKSLGEMPIERWNPTHCTQLDMLFASLPTGQSREALSRVPAQTRIVDIGGDHRYVDGWVYGLADIWPEKIRNATRVANPGCYPSAALTAIAPLLSAGLVDPSAPVIIDAKSGVSGAGRGGDAKLSFAETNEDVCAYGLSGHAHVREIEATTRLLSNDACRSIVFTPHLIPMTRGILATCYLAGTASTADCLLTARRFFADKQFVRVVDQPPHTKWAMGSNLALLSYTGLSDRGIIVALAAIDNLGKGAAGQAVQNANLMLGLPESAGLNQLPLWP